MLTGGAIAARSLPICYQFETKWADRNWSCVIGTRDIPSVSPLSVDWSDQAGGITKPLLYP